MKPPFVIHAFRREGFTNAEEYAPYVLSSRIGFLFVLEGEILTEVEGKHFLCGPGQFLLVPENKIITVKHFKDSLGYDGSFTLSFLKDASFPVLHAGTPTHQTFWFDDGVFMGALMKRMTEAAKIADYVFLQNALSLILCQLKPKSSASALPESFLQKVFDRNSPIQSVSDYALQLGVTANYLNKSVKAHTHRTAIEWIEISRLNLAKQLLKDRHRPIQEIAMATGLEDQSYFSRFFKKKTGLSPSEFRNQKENL